MTTVTISIDKEHQHFASIYKPVRFNPTGSEIIKYQVNAPYVEGLAGCRINSRGGVLVTSTFQPTIVIGEDNSPKDLRAWDELCERADRWNIGRDVLLTGRPLKVAARVYTPTGPHATGHQHAGLIAIQVFGDFTKSQLLEDKIEEIKGMFE